MGDEPRRRIYVTVAQRNQVSWLQQGLCAQIGQYCNIYITLVVQFSYCINLINCFPNIVLHNLRVSIRYGGLLTTLRNAFCTQFWYVYITYTRQVGASILFLLTNKNIIIYHLNNFIIFFGSDDLFTVRKEMNTFPSLLRIRILLLILVVLLVFRNHTIDLGFLFCVAGHEFGFSLINRKFYFLLCLYRSYIYSWSCRWTSCRSSGKLKFKIDIYTN